jgi:phosphoribosylformimino-5-aminoimidazole carboxamide ribotide isomerase
MLVIPAIDIKNGRCVRLVQGDPDRETVYSDDPAAVARRFEDMGARLIHVVDLDGAFEGRPVNRDLVAKIAKSVSVPIEIGGGIRSAEAVQSYLERRHSAIILARFSRDGFQELLERYAAYSAGIDAKNAWWQRQRLETGNRACRRGVHKELQKKGIGE